MTSRESKGPKISIILAVFNAGPTVGRTIESILSQDYQNKELVVIDGGSTDDTMAQVRKFNGKIDYLLSEPDNGIADAYNKGISAVTGEWIYFLNADDLFFSESTISDIFSSNGVDEDLIVGKVKSDQGRVFDGRFDWRLLIRNQIHHQAIFYRAKLLKGMPYNTQYRRYGHDHEHNILIWKKNISVHYVNVVIALWATGGVSDSANWKDYKEEFRIRRNTVGLAGYPFNLFTIGRFAVKRFLNLVR